MDDEIEVVQTPEPQVEEVEIVEDNPEPVVEKPEEKKPFDPKTDKVDFSTPEQQEKFNYMYKQAKQSDARNQMLTDLLQEQQKRLDELTSRFSQTDEAEAERVIMDKIRNARANGDDDLEFKAIDELAKFRAQKIVDESLNKTKTQIPVQEQGFNPNDVTYVESQMFETDTSGQPVRPWLNEGHPEFNNALNELERIAVKYVNDPAVLQKSLAELDTVMKAKLHKPVIQNRAPNPMQGGNLTNQKPTPKIKMTRQELEIARKLGVDPKRYAAQRDADLKKRGV